MKKNQTKLEKEWKNLEIGEMQEEDQQIDFNDNDQDSGYDLSGN